MACCRKRGEAGGRRRGGNQRKRRDEALHGGIYEGFGSDEFEEEERGHDEDRRGSFREYDERYL